jgi:hypothetical protein
VEIKRPINPSFIALGKDGDLMRNCLVIDNDPGIFLDRIVILRIEELVTMVK